MKITLFGTQPYDRESFDRIRDTYGFDICYHRSHLNANNVALAQGSDAVCIFVNDTADAGTIRQLAGMGVKLIALRCAGFNNVDLNAAARYGIPVVRVPAYSPHAVAEHAVALMLALNRKIHRAYWRTRDGNFSLHGLMGFDMYGKTAGIVGTGRIARELIRILKGFGMEVVANDLFPDPQYAAEAGIAYVPLDELYARADIVSLHCPLTDRTRYMIGDAAISRMKPGVILINTGRGQLIHTEALIDGLKEKKIGAAGLDVYEEEAGYFYEDTSDRIMDDDVLARLLSFNNVIVTSHQGFFTREAVDNIARTTMQNIKDFSNAGVWRTRCAPNRKTQSDSYEKDRFAPPRRERLEQGKPVHGVDRCGFEREGRRRGRQGRGDAPQGGFSFRPRLYLLSETGREDPRRRARQDGPGLDSGDEDLAAQREALRHASGIEQTRYGRKIR